MEMTRKQKEQFLLDDILVNAELKNAFLVNFDSAFYGAFGAIETAPQALLWPPSRAI